MIAGMPIGKRFRDCSFENYEITRGNHDALDACKRLTYTLEGGVILSGPVGTGKTHLMVALAKAVGGEEPDAEAEEMIEVPSISELIAEADAGAGEWTPTLNADEMCVARRVEFWPILDLVDWLRAEATIPPAERVVANRCRTCDLLILDDFGQERVTEFVFEELERIVDWRYREALPIAISTNMMPSQLAEKYGDRLISRWIGSCEVVKVQGADYRQRVVVGG